MENIEDENKIDRKRARKSAKKEFRRKKKQKETFESPLSEDWMPLDNAAMIYPPAANSRWKAMFRLSAHTTEEIDPALLDMALKAVMPRFPNFNVFLRKGLFWNFFEQHRKMPNVRQEKDYPLQNFVFRNDKHLFRVLYYKKKISLEMFHSLTDAFGGMMFLSAILTKYFMLKGVKVDLENAPVNFLDKPRDDELEDSFLKYADKSGFNPRAEKKAYQIHGTPEESGKLNILTGICSVIQIKAAAKKINCTITEFLTAVYFKALLTYQSEVMVQRKPVKISIPINLRSIFPSKTFKNFSSYHNITFMPEDRDMPLPDIAAKVKEQLKLATPEHLRHNINSNVAAQRNPVVRVLPLFIKDFALKMIFNTVGEVLYTTVVSNIGKFPVAKEIEPYLDFFEAYIGRGKKNKAELGVVSFGDKLSLSFSYSIREVKLFRIFFRLLTGMDCDVKLITNVL